MSDKDDPFGLSNDAGRTRIRPVRSDQGRSDRAQPTATPQPAGREGGVGFQGQAAGQSPFGASGARAPGGYAAHQPAGPVRVRHARGHPNALVAGFAALLELAPELERPTPPAQPDALRARMFDNLIDARDATVGMGVSLTRANQAAWFVAALIDDLALNTPWGGHSDWPRQSLVAELSGEVDAGTRFFDRVDEFLRHPTRDREMLELAYYCVGLGFRGKHRVQGTTGDGALMGLRAQIARTLRDADRDATTLSPHWQGVAAPDEPRRFAVPLWTVALAAVALVTAIHVGLGLQLGRKGEQLYALADRLPPAERAAIIRPVRDTLAPPPELTLEPVVMELLPEFQAKAPPETAAALGGREDASLTVLVVRGTAPEVFRSARADLNDIYVPLIASVAQVIVENAEVIGKVTVIGHTDSIPVQASNPFASNQGLSEARAAEITRLLVEGGVPAELVASEGRADAEPVADNGTKAGRAQNRRVEIKIEKKL